MRQPPPSPPIADPIPPNQPQRLNPVNLTEAISSQLPAAGPQSTADSRRLTTLKDETPSLEATIREGSETYAGGHVVEVTVIRAGTSSNNNHYPETLLRESAPLFDGARAFADHQPPMQAGQPRSVRDLVGHYRNPRYELTSQGGRLRADFHLLPGQDWLWGLIQEAERVPDLCGLSIDAKGEVKMGEVAGRQVRVVEAIRRVNSIDLVSKPAAGGSLDRILAADEDLTEDPETDPPVSSVARHPRVEEASDRAAPGIADQRPDMPDEAWRDHMHRAAFKEGDPLDAAARKKSATVLRRNPDGTSQYKFPIPDKLHATQALRFIDRSDLTPEEKAKVRARAHSVLGTTPATAKESDMPDAPVTDPETGNEKPEARSQQEPETTPLVEAAGSRLSTPDPSAEDLVSEFRKVQGQRDRAARELDQIREALAPAPPTPPDPGATAVQLLEQIKRDRDLEKSARVLDRALTQSKLPEAIQNRLRTRYDGRVFTEQQLTEDINDERDVLGKLSISGRVVGHGQEKPLVVGMSEYEQLQAAFDKLFDVAESDQAKSVPAFGGIRDAFRISTGVDIASIGGVDRPLQEAFQNSLRSYVQFQLDHGRLTEQEVLLREADVTTSTFSYLLGTSMNKRLLKDYQAWPSEWQKFCNVVAVKDFKLQDRIRLGAFGSLSTVAEDAAYTTLTLSDTHATYTPSKRGNLVQISRETIINDDLYAIKQIPQKLAVAAAFTLAEFVYSLLDPAFGNIYDSHSLFDATSHLNTAISSGNIGTANRGTALSSAAMQAATIAMRKQTNAASKPIGLKPRFLLTVPDLEFVAMTILKSAGLPGGANNDINPMMGYAEPIIAPQLNALPNLGPSTTVAMVVADPRVIDTVEVGFIGGQVNPVLFIQDQPLYGINFTQDVISYKVRHEYGGAVVDYRGFYLINN